MKSHLLRQSKGAIIYLRSLSNSNLTQLLSATYELLKLRSPRNRTIEIGKKFIGRRGAHVEAKHYVR